MGYKLEGKMLEVCTCHAPCPCFIGQDPDGGVCEGILAFQIERGTIDGVEVDGRTLVMVAHLPGNAFGGNWKVALFVDDQASAAQHDALVKVWQGDMGGPVADMAQLYGEVVAVESTPILFTASHGSGTLKIGSDEPIAAAEFANYKGATGQPTVLVDPIFSSVPGAPFYVGSAATYRRNTARYGLQDIDLSGHNAIQGVFRYEA